MNVLFLTIGRFESIEAHSIYPDLLREFRNQGHDVYVVCANERRTKRETELIEENTSKVLRVKIGNVTKTSFIEKGLSTLFIDFLYKRAINSFFRDVKFDLILYSTPPITLVNTIKSIKKKSNAKTYLLLKDIFPQNAVDLGILRKTGLKSILYFYFRHKEKQLYMVSDYIGCMSQANVDYVLEHNKEISEETVEICPNSIELIEEMDPIIDRNVIREKYSVPLEKTVFVYGGNLGKPQDIPFIIECLHNTSQISEAYFLIVGDGTDYVKLEEFVKKENPSNLKLLQRLPKEDFNSLVEACDVGMIFLDKRFTIPNFPSRLLSYLQAKIPVFACTDSNSDVGQVIEEAGCGWWCESDDVDKFKNMIYQIMNTNREGMGDMGYQYLKDNYTVQKSYKIIMKHF
ncbi:MAG: glycosyltransferase family 4 protein [Agathobacter sp.]|nr:glycosyltransferase family 4 protein [Agathobacter sp.]